MGRVIKCVHLTAREQDVLTLVGAGFTNPQIASALGLTLHTVKGYLKTAAAKLGAGSRLEALVLARRLGLIA